MLHCTVLCLPLDVATHSAWESFVTWPDAPSAVSVPGPNPNFDPTSQVMLKNEKDRVEAA